mmetsp:Transcript_26301/g.81894  ORF Transcript_26301/g.81894 Transcript_26301/m.81894 type:complete len:566 (+) Transcript_26301:258-1955(+)
MTGRSSLTARLLLLAAAARARPKEVSVGVRNLAGRDIKLSWLRPGPEPRERVEQANQPMRDGGMKSLNSFATHEFTAEAAVDVSRLPEDGHEKCGPWAASGECDANPGYMRASCVRACAVQDARNGSRLEVVFAIAEVSEIVTIKEINGKFVVERTGAVHDARKAVAAAFETCDDAREDETCAGDPAVCVAAELDAFFAPKRGELELEATIFEASVALAPVATPDPKAKKAYIEDLPALRGRIAAARRAPVNITDACPGAHKDCVVRTASDAAAVLESAIADARLATRARKQDKRNATCARDIPWTPHEPAVQTDWVWNPAADAALWGAEGAPADVPGAEASRRVAHLFRPAALPKAAIVLIDDFLSDEECDAVVAQATPRLQRATHAKDGNQTVVSETRNSQQATVMPANARDLSDPAARLQARSASFANFFSNFSLGLDGQEHLMAVQYNATQEYMLHCDGSCDGTPFRRGGRVATVLMYCEAAEGGGTAFPNANVHVVPKRGQAVYFHMRAPEADSNTEDWHTEHSGCPLKSGSKWVITQWLRDGVSKENPHSRFDPMGGPI